MVLGGGGSTSPLSNLIIELLGLVLLAAILWQPRAQPFSRIERAAIVLMVLIVATPLVQLIPLPPAIWRSLPGRELAVMIEDEVLGGSWRPLSIDPEAGWLAAAYLLPPAAIFLAALKLNSEERRRLVTLAVGGALLSLLLGALQFASGPGVLRLYESAHDAFATGFFINRNHQTDMLLIGMILASALFWSRRGGGNLWLWLAMIVAFTAGVLATASRTGFVLLLPAILASASFIPASSLRRRKAAAWGAGAAGCLAVSLIAVSATARNVLERFERLADARFEFWPDVLLVAGEYLPWGSGAGTFALAFRLREDLNRLTAPYFNHAHNDYLEILVETGLWGPLLTLIFIAGFLWLSFVRRFDPLCRAASFSIIILLLHSMVDYPLRMLSLLTLFGLLCALLVARRPERETGVPR